MEEDEAAENVVEHVNEERLLNMLHELRAHISCPFCEKSYKTKSAFKSHLKTRHLKLIKMNNLDQKYVCSFPHKIVVTSTLSSVIPCKNVLFKSKLEPFLTKLGLLVIHDVQFSHRQKQPNCPDVLLTTDLPASNLIDTDAEIPIKIIRPSFDYENFLKVEGVAANAVVPLASLLKMICSEKKLEPSLSCFLNVEYVSKCFQPSACRKYCKVLSTFLTGKGFTDLQCKPLILLYKTERKNTETGFGISVKETSLNYIQNLETRAKEALEELLTELLRNTGHELKIYRTRVSASFILASSWLACKCATIIGHPNTMQLKCHKEMFRNEFQIFKRRATLPNDLLMSVDKFLKVRKSVSTSAPNLFINSNGKPMNTGFCSATLKRLC